MLEFTLIKLMAVIFTPEFVFGDKLSIINTLNEVTENKCDGDLVSVPIPQDAPGEFPRIIMNSRDGLWKLEVYFQRINLIFFKPNLDAIVDQDAIDFHNFAKKAFHGFKKKTNVRVQRLAYITERVSQISDKTPAQLIADRYCKDEFLEAPFNRTQSFEIHSLKKYNFEKFDLNSWVRLKSIHLSGDEPIPVLLVTNDINTFALQEAPNAKFTLRDITRFFNKMPDHLESILNLYFPK